MPATAPRIAFITEQFRVRKSDDATVLTRFGDFARKTETPVETFFDSADDAAIVLAERQTLLGSARRRFTVSIKGVDLLSSLDFSQKTPTVHLIDTERAVDADGLVVSISADTETDILTLGVWCLA